MPQATPVPPVNAGPQPNPVPLATTAPQADPVPGANPMPQSNPESVHHVPRNEVPDVVKDILMEPDIKWIAIEFRSTENGVDFFDITPWNTDPR
jgi:hypothetical protein